jgi:putative transcriptional regulator
MWGWLSRLPRLESYTPLADRQIITAMTAKKAVRRSSGARVFWAPRVIAMRKTMGLSQRFFAKLVGLSVKTLQNWEQGRRQPSGPASVLLMVLLTDPDAVLRAMR